MRKRRKRGDIPSVILTQLGKPRRAEVVLTCVSCWLVCGEQMLKKQMALLNCLLVQQLLTDPRWNQRGARGCWNPLTEPKGSHLSMHSHPTCLHHQDMNDFIKWPLQSPTTKMLLCLPSEMSCILERVLMLGKLSLIFCSAWCSIFLMSSECIPFSVPTCWGWDTVVLQLLHFHAGLKWPESKNLLIVLVELWAETLTWLSRLSRVSFTQQPSQN